MGEIFQALKSSRPGPPQKPAIDGDKKQARQRVNMEIRNGSLPRPNDIPCADCGHVYSQGERRHEYDHYKGYAAEHHLAVEALCVKCHHKRDSKKAKQTSCIHGHKFDLENTGYRANGTRFCRECHRIRDRNRKRPDGYWKAVNARRKHQKYGKN